MKQKKKMTSTGFLLLITIVLFFVMYAAGMVIFADKGFAKPQMFLNLFVSNAGLLVISCGRWFCNSTCLHGNGRPYGK